MFIFLQGYRSRLTFSFGAATQAKLESFVEADSHADESQNHTLTIKYKAKSFLQIIGRIPVPRAPMDYAMDAAVKVEKDGVKIEKDGGEYIDTKKEDCKRAREQSPEFLEVDGTRSKKVKYYIDAAKVKEEVKPLKEVKVDSPKVKEEVEPLKEVEIDSPKVKEEVEPLKEVKVDSPKVKEEVKPLKEVKVDSPKVKEEVKPLKEVKVDSPKVKVDVEGGHLDRVAVPDFVVINGMRYDKSVKIEKRVDEPLKEVEGMIVIDFFLNY
jgi:hypothetical protein